MDDSAAPSRQIPVREDCWSEEATATLIEAWGRRYMELSRGNLRQKDWQEVADAVNAKHGHSKKTFRTDVQCKNRIDTIKKKYKTEKAKITSAASSNGSSWPFFDRLEKLIGPDVKKVVPAAGGGRIGMTSSPPMALPLIGYRKVNQNQTHTPELPTATPVVLPKKRAAAGDDSYFRRNYSAVAAAAAATEVDDDEEDEEVKEEDEDEERSRSSGERDEEEGDGLRELAKAIKRFGEIYARVEGEKQRQMVELEKQWMRFAKELEVQRMQMFMNTQVQLEKIKRIKGSGSNDIYS